MFPRFRQFRFLAFLLPAVCLAADTPVAAGWMGFRNDTSMTLVVQETVSAGRSGKSQKIFANETVRDTPSSGAQRTFTITDAAHPDKPLYTGRFAAPAENENVLYVLKSDGKGGLKIEPVKSPVGVSKHNKSKH
jgi:hypothetical protein